MPDCFDYICDRCGGEFHSDGDALVEYQEQFTEAERAALGAPSRVCDDCRRELMAGIEALSGMPEESSAKHSG